MVGLFAAQDAQADDALAGGRHTLTAGIITKPIGLYTRYDYQVSTRLLESSLGKGFWGDFEMGVYTQYFFYSSELGFTFAYQTDPALIRFTVDVALEPGGFIKLNGDEGGDPRNLENLPRRFGTRGIIRAVNYFNLKLDSFWLYSRTTAMARLRDFTEYDPFNQIQLKDEFIFEQATALFLPVMDLPAARARDGLKPRLWVYGEYTVGFILDVDTRPNRLSAGLVTENWPLPYFGMNLDVFYSFAREPIDGLGVILVWGVAW